MQDFAQYADWFYLIGAVLFILTLRGLSGPKTAIMGNRYGMIGMTLAVLCGELLAAQLEGEPLPVPLRQARALVPQRLLRPS